MRNCQCFSTLPGPLVVFYFVLPESLWKKRGSLICSLLHSGHLLGERGVLLLVNLNPQAKHSGGVIRRVPCNDLFICSRCAYTSFSGICVAWEISFAVHSPDVKSALISFLIVMKKIRSLMTTSHFCDSSRVSSIIISLSGGITMVSSWGEIFKAFLHVLSLTV